MNKINSEILPPFILLSLFVLFNDNEFKKTVDGQKSAELGTRGSADYRAIN